MEVGRGKEAAGGLTQATGNYEMVHACALSSLKRSCFRCHSGKYVKGSLRDTTICLSLAFRAKSSTLCQLPSGGVASVVVVVVVGVRSCFACSLSPSVLR